MNQANEMKSTDSVAQDAQLPVQESAQLSRRKFLTRAGVGSLPVIMSLQSGSAWGCVDLKCTPGETSMSNSGSAVASATTATPNNPAQYKKPNWSSIKTVQEILRVDFNDWLLYTYNKTLYTKVSKNNYPVIAKTNCSTWWTTVSTKVCYYRSGSSYPEYKDIKRQPAMYAGKVLKNDTTFASVFGGGKSSSFYTCLFATDTLEQYLVAAFIGSVWERHPEYKRQFPGRPICYPAPADIIKAYTDATLRVNGLKDLRSLLRFYTLGN